MATKASTPKTETPKAATTPRASATVELNFDDALEDTEIPESRRRSKWDDQLNSLYAATEEGKVPTDEAGNFKFVEIGNWGNENGARTQERTFIEREDLAATYEFRSIRKDGRSVLYARVVTVEDTPED